MSNNYKVNIHCVVLSTDIPNNKQYVLSTSEEDIEFPTFACSNEFLSEPDQYLISFIKKHIFLNDMELLPQLINLDNKYINDNKDTINIIYGFITTKTNSINEANWYEFSFTEPNRYSNILFEVTQKLK